MPALAAIRHLDHTVIFARDMAAMRRFYGETLEFAINRELGPQWIEFRVGSCLITLTERGLMWNDAAPPEGALSLQFAFRVAPAEVALCRNELALKGVAIIHDVTDQPWGHRTLFIRDPDGNIVEIYAEI